MAKEQFTRSKPHVLARMTPLLVQRGFTPMGAYQILHGYMVTDPHDRQLIADTMVEKEILYYKVEILN